MKKVNKNYEPIGFLALKRLLGTYVRILVVAHANVFLTVDSSYSKFVQLMKKTKDNNRIVPLYKDYSSTDNLSRLYK